MSRKPIPVPATLALQKALLFHPESNPTGFVPLENAAAHRFVPVSDAWSRTNAWWLADASWLAYSHDEAFVADAFSRAGVPACRLVARAGTECYVAHTDQFAIVTFRGTQPDDWRDLFNIARLAPRPWDVGLVHHGFADALDLIWTALQPVLDRLPPQCRVWFTGHSLGGALAVMAALRRAGQGHQPGGVYTFGSPRVGDAAFAAAVGQTFAERSIRYVNDHDVVTHVPPPGVAFPAAYTHVDRLRWITPDGHVGRTPPSLLHFVPEIFGDMRLLDDLVRLSTTTDLAISLPDALTDHTPLYYALHAWNDLDANG